MDHKSSLFSFDQIEELLEFSSFPIHQHDLTQQNDSQKQQFSDALLDNVDHKNNSRKHEKKIAHKEVERVRRQEMATLHRSLRSLLPVDRLKGKRAMADHIHETVGYIGQLEKSIKKLTETKDRLMNIKAFSDHTTTDLLSSSQTSVTVKNSLAGFEIVVNTAFIGGINLSRVLNILIAEGLSIISCISTKVDGRLLQKIETQVDDEGSRIGSTELRQKLRDYCNRNS